MKIDQLKQEFYVQRLKYINEHEIILKQKENHILELQKRIDTKSFDLSLKCNEVMNLRHKMEFTSGNTRKRAVFSFLKLNFAHYTGLKNCFVYNNVKIWDILQKSEDTNISFIGRYFALVIQKALQECYCFLNICT